MNGRKFTGWCLALLMLFSCAALADAAIEISADEWTWEANSVASFHGTITAGEDLPGAELTLTVETRLEDSGEALFTVLNGKKLKIRKKAPAATADLNAGEAFTFEGEWNLPAETEGGLAHAVITLTARRPDGTEIGSGKLEMGSQAEEIALVGISPEVRMNQAILYLAIGSVLLWGLAIGRAIWIHQKRKRA